jgi:hypothetical protein
LWWDGRSKSALIVLHLHRYRFGDQGLRTLLCAAGERDLEWWTGPNGWGAKYEAMRKDVVLEGPNEEGHFKGACKDQCRRCALEEAVERYFLPLFARPLMPCICELMAFVVY